jgi:hypothetical protein
VRERVLREGLDSHTLLVRACGLGSVTSGRICFEACTEAANADVSQACKSGRKILDLHSINHGVAGESNTLSATRTKHVCGQDRTHGASKARV